MPLLIAFLVLALIAAIVFAVVQQVKLLAVLKAKGPLGSPVDVGLRDGDPPLAWVLVDKGGNNNDGDMNGLGECPCQHDYTIAYIQVRFPARPNAAQIAAITFNPPAPDTTNVEECVAGCVNVMTHIWHGWHLFKNNATGNFLLNSKTYAQFHCKKPNDPDVGKPPKKEHPSGRGDVIP